MADDNNFYELIAIYDNGKRRKVLATDLTDEESDRAKREYINKHGCKVNVNGSRKDAQICIYRQRHEHKEFKEDFTEVIKK